jgi:hypothetical protein
MAEHVDAQKAEVILGTQDSHLHPIETDELGAGVQFVEGPVYRLGESLVQVHRAGRGSAGHQRGKRGRVLLRLNPEVNVSIGTQARLRVQPRDRPPFGEERLHSGRPEDRNGLLNLALAESRLEDLTPVCLLKLQGLGGGPAVR